MSTNIAEPIPRHKMWVKPASSALHSEPQNGFSTCNGDENQPRAQSRAAHAGSMNCDLLRWAARQNNLTPHLQGVLLRIVALMDENGMLAMPQAAIAKKIGVGETQTRAAIKALVDAGKIVRERRGTVGKGRQCDALHAKTDNNDAPTLSADTDDNRDVVALSEQSRGNHDRADNSGKSRLSADDNDDNSGKSSVSNPPRACIEHAGARGEDNLLTLELELNPERVESSFNSAPKHKFPPLVLNGSARGMAGHDLARVIVDQVNSPWLDPNRTTLGRTAGRISRWIQAGADFDVDILPTIKRVMATKREHIRTWGYFEDAVIDATRERLRAEAPLAPITANEAPNDQSPRPAVDGVRVRREPVSPTTAARMQRQAAREAKRSAIDLGRVESVRIE